MNGTALDSKYYPIAAALVNETYTDRLDKIERVTVAQDGVITVTGLDGRKRVQAQIDDQNIEIKVIN